MEFPVHIPFVQQLGLELHAIGDGEAELRLTIAEQHLTPGAWPTAAS